MTQDAFHDPDIDPTSEHFARGYQAFGVITLNVSHARRTGPEEGIKELHGGRLETTSRVVNGTVRPNTRRLFAPFKEAGGVANAAQGHAASRYGIAGLVVGLAFIGGVALDYLRAKKIDWLVGAAIPVVLNFIR